MSFGPQHHGRGGVDTGGRRVQQQLNIVIVIVIVIVIDDVFAGRRQQNVYVKHPVDYKYQSLNVSVPIEIDGKSIDATSAPIMFAINVGGYTSSSTYGATAQGGGVSAGNAGGGFGGGSSSGGAAAGASSVGLGSSMGSSWTSYDNGEVALATGYVVVEPGCRGRDQKNSSGEYYGKAPAAIIDLKAALRYVRSNKNIPGNTDWIITSGGSAGGALSALVGASGNSSLYDADLTALSAASADDNVFLSACYSPITDLNHADGQYECVRHQRLRHAQLGQARPPSTPSTSPPRRTSNSATIRRTRVTSPRTASGTPPGIRPLSWTATCRPSSIR
jgi:hypothetical protein